MITLLNSRPSPRSPSPRRRDLVCLIALHAGVNSGRAMLGVTRIEGQVGA